MSSPSVIARQLLVMLALCTASSALADTRRIAIVIGNNAGSGEMPPLRYAENDAGKMARVLVELGDVQSDDVMLLQGQKVASIERAIGEARDRVAFWKRSPDVRTVVFFYFSGHSDGEAIEIGPEKLAYPRLKALLQGTGADVRLVVVDACRSGAGLRTKGGKPVDAFAIRLADTLQATGEAFITSSAADEAALESSEVGGSYFTHNFISGLRGAADASGDKLVTLAEAYKYAYDRTVSSTAMLAVGAQHPNYDFRLSGQGELVLASLLKPSSMVVLPESDRALVTDLARDQVVVEVVGGAKEVALAPGSYGVRIFKGGQSWGGRMTLVEGQKHVVAMSSLSPVSSSVMVAAKGGPAVVQQSVSSPSGPVGLGLGISFGISGRLLDPERKVFKPKEQLRLDIEPLTTRFAGGPFFGALHVLALGEMSFGSTTNEAGAQLRLGYFFGFTAGLVSISVGGEVGGGVIAQLYGQNAASGVFVLAPRLNAKLRLLRVLSLVANLEQTFSFFNYTGTVEPTAWPAGSLGLHFTF